MFCFVKILISNSYTVIKYPDAVIKGNYVLSFCPLNLFWFKNYGQTFKIFLFEPKKVMS